MRSEPQLAAACAIRHEFMRQSTRREVYRLSSVSANEPFISANICWCDCRARKRTLRKWKRNIAVIDFGSSGVGDPACDWSIAWTLFEGESREAFRAALPVDNEAWVRGRGWTLWKALIVIGATTRFASRFTLTNLECRLTALRTRSTALHNVPWLCPALRPAISLKGCWPSEALSEGEFVAP